MVAGQRYLVERCGDGVAITSGRRAASTLGAALANTRGRREKAGATR
jgi:anaerobic glycerol-3-phosphate dehydrogenase